MPITPTASASPQQMVNVPARTRRRGHGHNFSPSEKFSVFSSPSRVSGHACGLRLFVLALIVLLAVSGLFAAVFRGALTGITRGRSSDSSPDVSSVSELEKIRELAGDSLGISLDCALGSQSEGCGVILGSIVVTLQGNPERRLHGLCLGAAIGQVASAKVRYLWTEGEEMREARVTDLLSSPIFDVEYERDGSGGREALRGMKEVELSALECTPSEVRRLPATWQPRVVTGVPWPDPELMPHVTMHADVAAAEWHGWVSPPSCVLQHGVGECYRAVVPAGMVAEMVGREGGRGGGEYTALYIQAGLDYEGQPANESKHTLPFPELCSGCPKKYFTQCAVRYAAQNFLRDQSEDFIVLGQRSSDAFLFAASFHQSRAPKLMQATLDRRRICPESKRSPHTPPSGKKGRAKIGGGVRTMREELEKREEEGRGGKRLYGNWTKKWMESGRGGRNLLSDGEGERHLSVRCAQLQMAELLLLEKAKTLKVSFPSPFATFLTARMAPGSVDSAKVILLSLCAAEEVIPITKQRIADQLVVDEKLKAIYCSVPKVACTSWKIWLRKVNHLPNPDDTWIVHLPDKSGLGELSVRYNEEEAIRVLTRRDFFKFAFVRNPFSRLVSTYLDKHVNGGPPHTRKHWNQKFFAKNRHLFLLKGRTDHFLNFSSFVKLVGKEVVERRGRIEPHIAPQADICLLNSIKYDFIGRFENLSTDAHKIMNRLKAPPTNAFSLGEKVHPTNSSAKIVNLYDKETYLRVKSMYKMDLDVELNDIHYLPPEALANVFGG